MGELLLGCVLRFQLAVKNGGVLPREAENVQFSASPDTVSANFL